jgi:hypothetical protein
MLTSVTQSSTYDTPIAIIKARIRLWIFIMITVSMSAQMILAAGVRLNAVSLLTPTKVSIATSLAAASVSLYYARNFPQIINGLKIPLLAVGFYFFALATTSLWALLPGATALKLLSSITSPAFLIIAFVYARFARPSEVITLVTSIVPLAFFALVTTYLLDPEGERILTSAPVFAAFAFPFLLYRAVPRREIAVNIMLPLVTIILATSNSRISIVMALVGLVAFMLLSTKLFPVAKVLGRTIAPIPIGFIMITALYFTSGKIAEKIDKTIDRMTDRGDATLREFLSFEGGDKTRRLINEVASELKTSGPLKGIGYGNFQYYFAQYYTDYSLDTVTGKDEIGMSLHNTYDVWRIEGGLLTIVVVFGLTISYLGKLWGTVGLVGDSERRGVAILCFIGFLQLAVLGFFHQMHEHPLLWISVGFGLGISHPYIENRPAIRVSAVRQWRAKGFAIGRPSPVSPRSSREPR